MPSTRHDQEVKIFVRLDQRVHHLHGRGGIDIAVKFADDQEQFSLQPMGLGHIGLFLVVVSNRPAHPLLVPPDFVHPIVVAAAIGNTDLVEVSMC